MRDHLDSNDNGTLLYVGGGVSNPLYNKILKNCGANVFIITQDKKSFTDIFHDKLLAGVSKLENVIKKEETKGVEIKISNISYGYDNSELIELLMARGKAFKNADFKKIQSLENKFSELIG